MGSKLAAWIIIAFFVVATYQEPLHEGFTACKVKDSNFESCLGKAIEDGAKYLKKGMVDYNLPPLDPYNLDSLSVGAGAGAVHLVQNYKDVTIHGLSDFTVNQSHVDFGKKTLKFGTIHPLLSTEAHYDVNGQVMMLPVHGQGPCTLSLENVFVTHDIQFEELKKDGDLYFIPRSYVLRMNPSHARYHFDNLFDGNKLLGDNINRLINEEWLTIYQDVGVGYEESFAKICLNYAQRIFEKTPVSSIFLQ